jgi:hypothetical protein
MFSPNQQGKWGEPKSQYWNYNSYLVIFFQMTDRFINTFMYCLQSKLTQWSDQLLK